MNKIVKKKQLSDDVFLMELEAPYISSSRKAGQFVILMLDDDYGERIPLTIADGNRDEGTITIIFQAVGGTTQLLSRMEEGDEIAHVLGPLGTPTHVEKQEGPVVCVGGGIGVAPLHPIVEAHKAIGNRVITIIGARSEDLLILVDEMRDLSDALIICTDDGSRGRKALVTEPLKTLCELEDTPSEVVAIGPPVMMKFCALTTKPYGVPTTVSLNTIMVDGTGMCGGCRVTVSDETKFVCVDGPEFDGHLVDWDSMMSRMDSYGAHEEDHRCNLDEVAQVLVGGKA